MRLKNFTNIFRSVTAFKHRPSNISSSAAYHDAASGSGGAFGYYQGSDKSWEEISNSDWFRGIFDANVVDPLQHKDGTRTRKFEHDRFWNGAYMSANMLGTLTTVNNITEGNALIKTCIEGARIAIDDIAAEKLLLYAFDVFKKMKEQGFPLEEESYGPFLEYFIEMSMRKEFSSFYAAILKANLSSLPKLEYYEMMFWIRANDEEKVQELCNDIQSYDGENKSILQVNYLLALCKSDRTKEIVQLLESMDITKFVNLTLENRT